MSDNDKSRERAIERRLNELNYEIESLSQYGNDFTSHMRDLDEQRRLEKEYRKLHGGPFIPELFKRTVK